MYSLAHARVNSQAKAFMSAWTAVIPNSCGMFLIVMQWISHCVQWQIDSVGVFVWALAPFWWFCFVSAVCFCFRWRNASLAGGFAGRRFWFGCGFCFCCFNRFADSKDLLSLHFCISCLLSCKDRASSATSATLEEKKIAWLGVSGCTLPALSCLARFFT